MNELALNELALNNARSSLDPAMDGWIVYGLRLILMIHFN